LNLLGDSPWRVGPESALTLSNRLLEGSTFTLFQDDLQTLTLEIMVKNQTSQNWKLNIPVFSLRQGECTGGFSLSMLGLERAAFCSFPETLKPKKFAEK